MAKPVRRKKISSQVARDLDNSADNKQAVMSVRQEALSDWPMILGWVAMLIFTFHACTHMVAAGDTWVAMACGRHFVNHGVDTVEPFSANSHKAGPTEEEIAKWPKWAQWITNKVGIETVRKWHPTGWINQNWLTHVIFYKLVPQSSYADGLSFTSNALVYWKFAIYIVTVICVYYTCRLLGVNPALAVVFSCFALFIGRSFIDIRPAGFSNMLAAVFLLILALATYRNVLFIWLIVPLVVFWCNVHGGYIYVFIMMIPFIGIHFCTCLNKKWTAILYNVVAWPFLIIVFSKAGFTFPTFLFMVLIVVLDFILILSKDKLVTLEWKGFYHTIGASVASFLAAIVFNPFHLTNLTHTFVISVSKNAERWRDIHEWHPAFDWTNPVGTAVPFLIMYIMVWLALVAWILAIFIVLRANDQYNKRKRKATGQYQWPKIDISLMLIGALTIYMALRSRRFIPIAAIAACPLIAFIIQELVRCLMTTTSIRKCGNVTSFLNEYARNVLEISIAAGLIIVGLWQLLFGRWLFYPIPGDTEGRLQPRIVLFALGVFLAFVVLFLTVVFWPINRHGGKTKVRDEKLEFIFSKVTFSARLIIFAFVVSFGIWFSMRFKSVYLDPWPNDPKFTSVFMRMTASDAKPFYAMKYIKDNKLEGKMFNYWTEGGAIAWGQEPDPNTGRTQLQLFMDGRAQAAYNRSAFDEWSHILAGGQIATDIIYSAQKRGQEVTDEDYVTIENYVSELLRERNVWIILMPASVFNDPDRSSSYYTFRALENYGDWRLVLENDKQKLLVDIRTEQGRKLYEGIRNGQTIYPDEYHKDLIRANRLLLHDPNLEDKIQGLKYAIEAFNARPSPVSMLEIIVNAARYRDLLPDIQKFCQDFSESFEKNKEDWIEMDGYRHKVEAARLANLRLVQMFRIQGNEDLVDFYDTRRVSCLREIRRISLTKRW